MTLHDQLSALEKQGVRVTLKGGMLSLKRTAGSKLSRAAIFRAVQGLDRPALLQVLAERSGRRPPSSSTHIVCFDIAASAPAAAPNPADPQRSSPLHVATCSASKDPVATYEVAPPAEQRPEQDYLAQDGRSSAVLDDPVTAYELAPPARTALSPAPSSTPGTTPTAAGDPVTGDPVACDPVAAYETPRAAA